MLLMLKVIFVGARAWLDISGSALTVDRPPVDLRPIAISHTFQIWWRNIIRNGDFYLNGAETHGLSRVPTNAIVPCYVFCKIMGTLMFTILKEDQQRNHYITAPRSVLPRG
jgi:hypothetical protein